MSARRSPFSDETGSPTFGKLAALPGIMEDVASIKLRTAMQGFALAPQSHTLGLHIMLRTLSRAVIVSTSSRGGTQAPTSL